MRNNSDGQDRRLESEFDVLQPIEWAVAGCLGSLVVVAILVLRIYLGWAYVGDRLLSAAVPYEETGWYGTPCMLSYNCRLKLG